MKKFEMIPDETTNRHGRTLFRIKACIDFVTATGYEVRAGDWGGFVETEQNLSHDGKAWIADEAKVYGQAAVFEDAEIFDNAEVFDYAEVYGHAIVCDTATVYGRAEVCGNATVCGHAELSGNTRLRGDNRVCAYNAWMFDEES